MSDKFVGVVVDVNDPEKAGRLKIRIHGMHDDEMNISDDMLPWARCVYPVTNPISKGVSGPTTGVVVGTVVIGHFADPQYKQIPIIEGTLGRNSDKGRDFPKANAGEDFNEVLEDNIFHIGTAELKHVKSKTIGTIEYSGQSIEKMVGFIEKGHFSAAIDQLREIKSQIQYLKNLVLDSPIEQINLVIAGFKSDIMYEVNSEVTKFIDDELKAVLGSDFRGTIDKFGNVVDDLGNTVGRADKILGTDITSILDDADSFIGGLDNMLTTKIGSVVGTVDDVTGAISSVTDSKLLNQIIAATGVNFTSPNHLIGSIGDRLSKRAISSYEDAINRVNGYAFTMETQMKSVENTFTTIKKLAKKKNTDV